VYVRGNSCETPTLLCVAICFRVSCLLLVYFPQRHSLIYCVLPFARLLVGIARDLGRGNGDER